MHKKIFETVVTLLVIFMLAFYPAPFAVAQEAPTDNVIEDVVDEPVPEQQEQSGGESGSDGGDASNGSDGSAGGTGGDSAEPQSGNDGGDTGDAGAGGDGSSEGEEGTGGEEENNTGNEETSIDTGDAFSEGGINNSVNLSELQALAEEAGYDFPVVLYYIYFDSESGEYRTSDPGRQDELDEALLDGILDPQEYLQIVTPENDVTASTTNDAFVENDAEIVAETGENSASFNENVTINTGDATAVANVLNVVNTNIFDSEGFFLFLDNLTSDGVQGDLDFRDFDFFNPSSVDESTDSRISAGDNPITAICPTCGGAGDLTINTGQNAGITNDVVVRSGTGQNEGLYNSGDTTINTGDAYAAANVINLANTNIVDSNYLLLTFNNYGDYDGDIVFPSAGEFLDMFETGGQTTPSQITVNSTSTAGVDNNSDVQGITGENIAHETPDGGTITTGSATTANNTLNQINSNLFGGSSFSILVKVNGEWDGDVIGIPDGMTWRETSEGIELIYDSEGAVCDGTSACDTYDAIDVTTKGATQITNNISVVALTGENKIEGAGGDAEINTGDAYAAANTINVANTNVIGKNWMMAVINIFGDWNGNITFGQSNLWVGAQANISEVNPTPGTSFTYTYTVMNTGDAPATNVCITNRFDSRLVQLQVLNPSTDREVRQGEVEYCIGTVDAGEVREITRSARIADRFGYGTTYVTNDIEVQGSGEEAVEEDNYESVTFGISIDPPKTYSSGTKVEYKASPELSISKVNSSPYLVYASSTVNYRVIVKNTGAGSAYKSVLIDTLYDEEGNKVYEEYWNLGEIYAGEYIEIVYTTFFNEATEPGLYRNEARVEALGGYHTFKYGYDASTETVESTIKIAENPYLNKDAEVIEVIEESKEITETIDEGIIEEPRDELEVDNESEDGQADSEEIITIAKSEPQFAVVFGPYNGPFYYEKEDESVETTLSVLFDHPQFTPHPVNLAKNSLFNTYPLFTQHPVYIKRSLSGEDTNSLASFEWIENLTAGIGFVKFLSLPFRNLSYNNKETEENDGGENTLALIALSMFVLRKPVSPRKRD